MKTVIAILATYALAILGLGTLLVVFDPDHDPWEMYAFVAVVIGVCGVFVGLIIGVWVWAT